MILPKEGAYVENGHACQQENSQTFVESVGESGASNSSQAESALSPTQQLKATISFRALVESDGRELKQSGKYWQCRCPFHPDKTPSFTLWETDVFAKCFGCHWEGDIFDYVMKRTGCDFRTAFEHLATTPTLHRTKTKHVPLKSRNVEAEYQFKPNELKEIERSTSRICNEDWLCAHIAVARNWKPQTIRQLAKQRHLGWGGDVLEFIYKTGIKARRWPGKEISWRAGQPYIWRADMLFNAQKVFITEGEPDAITLIDLGVESQEAVAVVAAPSASTFHNAWAKLFIGKDVTLCYDADKAGRKGVVRVGALLAPVASSISELILKEVA